MNVQFEKIRNEKVSKIRQRLPIKYMDCGYLDGMREQYIAYK